MSMQIRLRSTKLADMISYTMSHSTDNNWPVSLFYDLSCRNLLTFWDHFY